MIEFSFASYVSLSPPGLQSFSSFSVSQMEITGKSFEKRTKASVNPAHKPAIIDHSTQEGA